MFSDWTQNEFLHGQLSEKLTEDLIDEFGIDELKELIEDENKIGEITDNWLNENVRWGEASQLSILKTHVVKWFKVRKSTEPTQC